MYCVGLTGGIASGKSTVAAYFKNLHYDIVSADLIAKQLTAKGAPALERMVEHFGAQILHANQELNRAYVRELVFKDDNARIWLEQLLHPNIREKIARCIQESQASHVLIEIPLLTDRGFYPYLNHVICLIAPHEQQIQRLMRRDHCSDQQALNILAHQPSQEAYRAVADEVIINDGDLDQLYKQLERYKI